MSTVLEFEAQKASLARQVLSIDNQNMLNNVWLVLNGGNQQEKPSKREIGFLEGKANFSF